MSRRSVADGEPARDEPQVEPLGAGDRAKLDLQHAQEVDDRHVGDLRPHRAGVEARNVEQGAKDLLDRLQRDIDIARQIGRAPRVRSGRCLRRASWRRAGRR